jgi:hypothetical protein|tara:strand:- start:333 stop:503 length:171 start_codon:yes stop_codon:yes gene_type:complete
LVIPTLKETKEANPIFMIFVMPTIPYRRDPADRMTCSFCDEQTSLGRLIKGVLYPI